MREARKPACLSSAISTWPWTCLGGHGGGGPGVDPHVWLLQADSPLKPSRCVWKAAGTAALPQARSLQHRLEAQLPGVDGPRPVCEEGRRQGPICFPLMATCPVRSREQRPRPVGLPPAGQLLSYRRRGPSLVPHPSALRLDPVLTRASWRPGLALRRLRAVCAARGPRGSRGQARGVAAAAPRPRARPGHAALLRKGPAGTCSLCLGGKPGEVGV